MIRKFLSLPIRTHLIILLSILAFPCIVLIVRSGIEQRGNAVENAKKDCLAVVRTIAAEQAVEVAGAEQLMTALSLVPEVHARNIAATNVLLASLVRQNPQYANIVIADKSGSIWASALPFTGKRSMADRKHYQDAIQTGTFASGEYNAGRITGRGMMGFGYPVKNASNKIIDVIAVSVDLGYSQHTFESIAPGAGTSFSITDRQGTMIIRDLRDSLSERLIGKRDTNSELFTRAQQGPEEGTFEAMGNDGRLRLVAYKRLTLPQASEPYLYVRSGVPLAFVTSKANAAMSKNLGAVVLLFGIGFLIVWFLGKRVIVSPIMRLKEASRELATGEHTVVASQVVRVRELRDLARTFDGMSTSLAEREAALRESQSLLRAIMENTSDPAYVKDAQSRILMCNPAMGKVVGKPLDEITGKTDSEYYGNPVVGEILRTHDVYVMESGQSLTLEETVPTPDGDRTFLSNKAPYRDVSGNIIGIIGISHDITEHKRSEEAVLRHLAIQDGISKILRAALTSATERELGRICLDVSEKITESKFAFIGEVGRDGHLYDITISDPGWEACTMYDKSGHRRPPGNFLVHGLYGWVLSEGKSLFTNDPSNHPGSIGLPDGHPALTAFLGVPLVSQGKAIGIVAVANRPGGYDQGRQEALEALAPALVESFERKRAEEALRRARDELELRVAERTTELQSAHNTLKAEIAERKRLEDELRQAQKMEALGTLTGGIAHDFNNILAGIIGFTEMVLDDDLPPDSPAIRHLQLVLKGALRGRDLVKQMLTFSHKTEYDVKPIALAPLLKETVKLLRASIPTTIGIELKTPATSDTVLANATGIQQIIMNLATNAAHAMRENGGKMTITLSDAYVSPDQESKPGAYLELIVEDTGVGIDASVLHRIFEPFFTTKETGEGTGMGLAVVYGIVKSLNGNIFVESTPGAGSTFRVVLLKAEMEEPSEDSTSTALPTGHEKILFVDDEEMLAELGEDILKRLGYRVASATSSREALKLFYQDPLSFDLVITDQTMPELTGLRLAERLLTVRPDLPIILCTGFGDGVDSETAKTAGVKGFVMKPLVRKELAQMVRDVLDAKGEA
ncbi:MAG TPA: ATP-binding protein [Syntrophorhabdaceae bacterium]|nr:ATP-binding protein [Syntrophorhabdaceae bacterium]